MNFCGSWLEHSITFPLYLRYVNHQPCRRVSIHHVCYCYFISGGGSQSPLGLRLSRTFRMNYHRGAHTLFGLLNRAFVPMDHLEPLKTFQPLAISQSMSILRFHLPLELSLLESLNFEHPHYKTEMNYIIIPVQPVVMLDASIEPWSFYKAGRGSSLPTNGILSLLMARRWLRLRSSSTSSTLLGFLLRRS